MLKLSQALLLPLLLDSRWTTTTTHAEKDSNPYPWGENPNNQFKMYWNDASNVLQDLEKFAYLYIRYQGCVWSECSVDNYDDDGENRDGDEYWYQDRTQPFCANAAYTLHGILKGDISGWNSCNRHSYINSFFTYGGADTIMDALDVEANTVFTDYESDNAGNSYSNSVCYKAGGNNNNNNKNNNNKNSGDNGGDSATSSTMGCSSDSKFVVATFTGETCDGNNFLQTTDYLTQYNKAMDSIKCHQIWNYKKHYTSNGSSGRALKNENQNNDDKNKQSSSYSSPAQMLLANSWACDISVYPTGCPDPYGLKRRYDAVLQAVSNGSSSRMAIANARLKKPLSILAWFILTTGTGFLCAAYYIANKLRIRKLGLLPCVWEDLTDSTSMCCCGAYDRVLLFFAACGTSVAGLAKRQRKVSSKRLQRKQQKKEEQRMKKHEKKKKDAKERRFPSLWSKLTPDDVNSAMSQGSTDEASKTRPKSRSRREAQQQNKEDDQVPSLRYPSGRMSWAEASVASGDTPIKSEIL